MKNVTDKTKIILFAGLLLALILPFSNLEMIDAASEDKADKTKKVKDDSKNKETKQ